MAEAPEAFVVHVTPSRLRLRVPAKRNDKKFFSRASGELAQKFGGVEVETNAATGSILLRSVTAKDVVELLAIEAPFRVVERSQLPAAGLREVRQQLTRMGDGVQRFTSGTVDARTLVLLALLASGIIQLSRGQIFAPAMSLFWYAAEALRNWAPEPDQARQ